MEKVNGFVKELKASPDTNFQLAGTNLEKIITDKVILTRCMKRDHHTMIVGEREGEIDGLSYNAEQLGTKAFKRMHVPILTFQYTSFYGQHSLLLKYWKYMRGLCLNYTFKSSHYMH